MQARTNNKNKAGTTIDHEEDCNTSANDEK